MRLGKHISLVFYSMQVADISPCKFQVWNSRRLLNFEIFIFYHAHRLRASFGNFVKYLNLSLNIYFTYIETINLK